MGGALRRLRGSIPDVPTRGTAARAGKPRVARNTPAAAGARARSEEGEAVLGETKMRAARGASEASSPHARPRTGVWSTEAEEVGWRRADFAQVASGDRRSEHKTVASHIDNGLHYSSEALRRSKAGIIYDPVTQRERIIVGGTKKMFFKPFRSRVERARRSYVFICFGMNYR